jgi:CRISPR-associated endonuclease/helicase Cas3
MILAKPSGITLKEHVDNVVAEANSIINSFPFVFEKHGINLAKRLLGACKFHDDGKKHPRWQNACQKDYQIFLDWQKKNGGTYSDFERKNRKISGANIRKASIRHEIDSLLQHKKHGFSLPVQIAIAAHHNKLNQRFECRWIDQIFGIYGKKLFETFLIENNKFRNSYDFKLALNKYLEYAGVRSLLILADHRASIKESNKPVPQFNKFSYRFSKDWDKRPVQKIAEDNWKEDLLLVRAPTGAGKTDAALLWAKKQIDNNKADRLIIAMPTRFTSNALSINVSDSLSETGLYHSSAWFNKFYYDVKDGNKIEHLAKLEHEFARQLLTPVTVITIDHLLIALTLTREDHHSILFNLSNSCVVIDEADFYDEFTQANILVLLEAIKEWKVPVMIMSASLPEITIGLYKSIGFNLSKIHEDISDNKRIRCKVKTINKYEKVNELDSLLNKCIEKGTAIIYANTVAKAMEFYEWFEKHGVEPILYHSRFTEPDKMKKENELIDHLGKKAWKNGNAKGIAIMTQIGEMSVNISANFMISDICPMDRLVQRIGRLSRFSKSIIGELHVLIPIKNEIDYPAPYGNYEKRKWIPIKPYLQTIEFLEKKEYNADDFISLINKIYPNIKEFNVRTKNNATKLKEHFVFSWLVTPLATTNEDNNATEHWKSRDIVGNQTVFVKFPDYEYFSNYLDFKAFKNENTIDVHPYLIKQGINKYHTLSLGDIYIGDEKENIIYINNPDIYNFKIGLKIDNEVDQFL